MAQARSTRLIEAARELAAAVEPLAFPLPVTHVLNPLSYAWGPHEAYLRRYGTTAKRVVFLGMNPGPFGMVQTGVPFGEVAAVRDWLGIEATVDQPGRPNPYRPVEGFACARSEVSGARLWGLFRARFGSAEAFFREHFVLNYCPLAFFERGRNVTPDKLPSRATEALFAACDRHLIACIEALEPHWVIGVGKFAQAQAERALAGRLRALRVASILHPSPASPAANRGWAAQAGAQLEALGVWPAR
ncbi:MAG: single-stranded DNA-binding protein [Casimicrobiaceae bacterium]|nr:single-stranded DNA-binding protein [Casimicrobiaceae bacterium]MDW8311962.1 single-stranded DNA-binding protein [Burkholderiales bacterium]